MKVEALESESIELFQQSIIARGAATNTVKAYSTDLRMLLRWYTTEQLPIPMSHLEGRAANWLNSTRLEVAPRTTNRRLVSVRSFAKWGGMPYLLSEYRAPSPGRPIPHPIAEGKDGLLRMAEVSRNPSEKALVGLCGFIGMRIGEALTISLDSFDMQEKLVKIRGKGDKSRIVPVSDAALDCIGEAIVAALPKGTGTPIVQYQLRHASQVVKDMGQRAKLSREIASHDLRHTYATLILDGGANLRVVQELLGHASSATTEGYTAVHVDSMRAAVNF